MLERHPPDPPVGLDRHPPRISREVRPRQLLPRPGDQALQEPWGVAKAPPGRGRGESAQLLGGAGVVWIERESLADHRLCAAADTLVPVQLAQGHVPIYASGVLEEQDLELRLGALRPGRALGEGPG